MAWKKSGIRQARGPAWHVPGGGAGREQPRPHLAGSQSEPQGALALPGWWVWRQTAVGLIMAAAAAAAAEAEAEAEVEKLAFPARRCPPPLPAETARDAVGRAASPRSVSIVPADHHEGVDEEPLGSAARRAWRSPSGEKNECKAWVLTTDPASANVVRVNLLEDGPVAVTGVRGHALRTVEVLNEDKHEVRDKPMHMFMPEEGKA